ncbi:MAG TPA: CoA-binding protein [Terriglobia bacterium]|nr:CoA-binding protein [Terriglobia bacterium]
MRDRTRQNIDDFLAQRRLALVGVSRNPKDFSHTMFVELRRRGYDMVPVNPNATEVDGVQCFARLQEVAPPVDGALVMTPADQSEGVVRDCAQAGIGRVWLHRGAGTGAVSWEAVNFCREQGMSVVAGFCPYMFLPKAAFFHRAHTFFMKLGGSYPDHARPHV